MLVLSLSDQVHEVPVRSSSYETETSKIRAHKKLRTISGDLDPTYMPVLRPIGIANFTDKVPR